MQPEELYELDTELTQDLSGAALLVHLEGFMDAGAAGRLLTEHLLDAFEHTTVARFDTDRLLDYRSRRPLMTFDGGKWESYDAPELCGVQAHGQRGQAVPAAHRAGAGPRVGGVRGRDARPRRAPRRRADDHLLRRADGHTAHPAARRHHARDPARAW